MQSDLIIAAVSIYIFIFLSVNKQSIVLGLPRLMDTAKNIAYYLSSRDSRCKNSFSLHPYLMLGAVIPTGLHKKMVLRIDHSIYYVFCVMSWGPIHCPCIHDSVDQIIKINIVSNHL